MLRLCGAVTQLPRHDAEKTKLIHPRSHEISKFAHSACCLHARAVLSCFRTLHPLQLSCASTIIKAVHHASASRLVFAGTNPLRTGIGFSLSTLVACRRRRRDWWGFWRTAALVETKLVNRNVQCLPPRHQYMHSFTHASWTCLAAVAAADPAGCHRPLAASAVAAGAAAAAAPCPPANARSPACPLRPRCNTARRTR
jgi:hypothetical protein